MLTMFCLAEKITNEMMNVLDKPLSPHVSQSWSTLTSNVNTFTCQNQLINQTVQVKGSSLNYSMVKELKLHCTRP